MNYPKDLAKRVWSTIKSKKHIEIPIKILNNLFELMFFSSLKTEELAPITYSIVYIDPVTPDPKPPERLVADRWSCVEFKDNIPFNLSNIIKLAKASDPRSSSLAIYHDDKDEIFIWGFIDQINRYNDYINFESDAGPERPGVFQASVESQGYIIAYLGLRIIAELRQNRLVSNSLDVFKSGPIRDALQPSINMYIKKIKRTVNSSILQDRDHWEDTFSGLWISALCRLLIRIKNFKHGGAILLTSSLKSDGLNIKYGAKYDRLKKALLHRASLTIKKTYSSDLIFEEKKNIPIDIYLDESVFSSELDDVKNEIDGALWFLSLLSRVDGLILFTKHLSLKGFGVEIITKKDPKNVYRSKTISAGNTSLQKLDFNYFGTSVDFQIK